VDGAVDWFQQLPERRGGVVAQDSALTTGENRRHPAPVPARRAVTDGVDAAVEAVELPAREAVSDRSGSQTGAFELMPRNDSVLSSRDLRCTVIGGVDFLTHVGT